MTSPIALAEPVLVGNIDAGTTPRDLRIYIIKNISKYFKNLLGTKNSIQKKCR